MFLPCLAGICLLLLHNSWCCKDHILNYIRTKNHFYFLLFLICFYYRYPLATKLKNISSGVIGSHILVFLLFLICIYYRYPLATKLKNISSGVIGSHILVFLLFFDLYLFRYPLATMRKNISSGVIGSHILLISFRNSFYLSFVFIIFCLSVSLVLYV